MTETAMIETAPSSFRVGRVRGTTSPTALDIEITPSRNWFHILVLGVWLLFWPIGVLAGVVVLAFLAVASLGLLAGAQAEGLTPREWVGTLLFIIVWLAAWLGGGAFAASVFLWQTRGAERITIAGGILTLQRKIPYVTRERTYPLDALRGLRPRKERNMWGLPSSWLKLGMFYKGGFHSSFLAGTVEFWHGQREAGLGLDLSAEETAALIERLAPFIPADGAVP